MEIAMVIIVVIAVTAVLTFVQMKRRQSEWIGTVEKKTHKSFEENDGTLREEYLVVFSTDAGKKIKLRLNESWFEKYEEGFRYHKRSGEDFPIPIDE
ncbi:hypothetical protein JW905_12100 [bacterium]|nr:hypothetical protein [candidate division CSSED10-310 bacterium]